MANGNWPVGSTCEPTMITIMLGPGASPRHVGAGFRLRAPSGEILTERGFNWQPTSDQLAAALPLIQALIGDLLSSEGVDLDTGAGRPA
jgi:hypothetical protein